MAWQCMKCLHHIPNGVSHSCINDEMRDLQKRYTDALKMLEEMAESYKKYAMHIDGCLYFFGSSIEYACNCGLDDVLNKYRKFKEGLK